MRSAALVAGLAAALAAACAPAPEPGPTPVERAAFATRPAVAEALARLEAEAPDPVLPDLPPEDSEPYQEARGLAVFLATARADLADAAFEDVKRLGDAAIPVLLELARDVAANVDDRRAALRLIGELGSPASGLALTREMADNPTPSLRAVAAWKLEGHPWDGCVTELLRRLKYEKDPSVVPWIARALASHGNYGGLGSLETLVAWYGTGTEAAGHLVDLAGKAGFEESLAGAAALSAAWAAGDPDGLLPAAEPSPRRELDAWRRIERLAEFQLRGVDDSRFILASLGAWAAPLLAEALHDEDAYVRLHVAQVLQRMGPRGAAAVPELVAALAEPGLAPTAAMALGASGSPEAEPVLLEATGAGEAPELRLAAVRALGLLGSPSALPALEELAATATFPELDQALVEAQVRVRIQEGSSSAHLVPRLLELARDPSLDGTTSARVLREWIGAEAAAEASLAAPDVPAGAVESHWTIALRDAWDALNPDPWSPPTPQEDAERRAAQLGLVDDLVQSGRLNPIRYRIEGELLPSDSSAEE